MNGPPIGRLYQDLVSQIGDPFDVLGSQRCPSLPGVDVLPSEGHDSSVVKGSGEADPQWAQVAPLYSKHLETC